MSTRPIIFLTRNDFDFLAAEVIFKGQRLCQLMRRNDDCVEIEFLEERYELEGPVAFRFPLDEFISTLSKVKEEMLLLRKDGM